jgi:hypothetical protein
MDSGLDASHRPGMTLVGHHRKAVEPIYLSSVIPGARQRVEWVEPFAKPIEE